MATTSPIDMLDLDFQRVTIRLAGIVPEIDPAVRARSTSPVGKIAGTAIAAIIDAWNAADDALDQAEATIVTAGMNTALSAFARRQQMNAAAAQVSTTVAGYLATATTTADRLAVTLARTALPPRPATTDPALQEALIAAVKADVQMVLDRAHAGQLPVVAAGLVADYVAAGDNLAVWVLTASPWPALYFKSRGVAVSDFTTLISKAVAGADDPEQTRARQILDAFNGSSGVRALTVLAQTLGNMRLTTLRNSYALA
jgi:hypothetical protein